MRQNCIYLFVLYITSSYFSAGWKRDSTDIIRQCESSSRARLFLWDTSITHEEGIAQVQQEKQPCSISSGSSSVYLIYGTHLEQSPAKARSFLSALPSASAWLAYYFILVCRVVKFLADNQGATHWNLLSHTYAAQFKCDAQQISLNVLWMLADGNVCLFIPWMYYIIWIQCVGRAPVPSYESCSVTHKAKNDQLPGSKNTWIRGCSSALLLHCAAHRVSAL